MRIVRIRRALKKYNGVVVLLGALIVAALFFVKDAWREKLKDDSDAANAAINLLMMRDDNLNTADGLKTIQKEVDELKTALAVQHVAMNNKSAQRQPPPKPDAQPDDPLLPIYVVLNNLDEFANSYPYEDVWKKIHEFSDELARLAVIKSQYDDNEQTGKNPLAQMGLFLQYTVGGTALLVQIDAYKVSLTANSIGEREQRKKQYERATRYGYALFLLGLTVTVLPKLIGVEDKEKDADETDIFDLVS